MKKLVAVILSVILVMVPTVALAKEPALTVPDDGIIGYLTDDNGNTIEVKGFIVETAMVNFLDADLSVTYGFNLAVPTSTNGSGEYTESSPDTAMESTVYLTIYYKTQNPSTGTTYLLTSVSGYWEIDRPNSVSVESASVRYGCSDIGTTQSRTRAVGNNFSFSTGFSNYVSRIGGVMGARLTVNYLMGTSRRWSFTLTNNLFNDGITY